MQLLRCWKLEAGSWKLQICHEEGACATDGLTALLLHVAQVRRVFLNDFGRAPEEVFASFEPAPIASASLAQVQLSLCRPRSPLSCGTNMATSVASSSCTSFGCEYHATPWSRGRQLMSKVQ